MMRISMEVDRKCSARGMDGVFSGSHETILPRVSQAGLPFPLTGQSLIQTYAGSPVKLSLEFAGIRKRMALVPGSSGFLLDDKLSAGDGLQLLKNFPDADHFAAADVVDLAGSCRNRRNRRIDAIRYVSVAAYLPAIAENRYRLLAQQRTDKNVITHIGPLAGTIDREITQRDDGNVETFSKGPAKILTCQFRHAIG